MHFILYVLMCSTLFVPYSNADYEGLAPVQVDNRWGFIDTNGRFVINPQFDRAEPFAEGLAPVLVR